METFIKNIINIAQKHFTDEMLVGNYLQEGTKQENVMVGDKQVYNLQP